VQIYRLVLIDEMLTCTSSCCKECRKTYLFPFTLMILHTVELCLRYLSEFGVNTQGCAPWIMLHAYLLYLTHIIWRVLVIIIYIK
jgi:hypothetical protein